ncbi:MAG: FAD-binding protein [Trueperaceae bacterium]
MDRHLGRVATDVLVVGSGGAGLRAALAAHDEGAKVVLVSKGLLRMSHTRMSGGRFQAVTGFDPEDSRDLHFKDTMAGGAYLNNPELVQTLVDDSLDRAYDLEDFGLIWGRVDDTEYRVVGVGGGTRLRLLGAQDEGVGIAETLINQMFARDIPYLEYVMAIELLMVGSRVAGAIGYDLLNGGWVVIEAQTVILATGGASQLYATNSGPILNSGDGLGMAFRAGAELIDMEFFQYIPISFVYPQSIRGYTLLEPQYYGRRHWDVDGEPGHLLNIEGERFMKRYDPERMESGTRDVLAQAIFSEIRAGRGTPEGGVYLKADKSIQEIFLKERPMYVRRILENYGPGTARFDDPLQVTPSALYTVGGVRIDANGRTSIDNLFAAGEVSGGVHGANRVGGNSLPDIQVFGFRAGKAAAQMALAGRNPAGQDLDKPADDVVKRAARRVQPIGRNGATRVAQVKKRIQEMMWDHVGVIRDGAGLAETLDRLSGLRKSIDNGIQISAVKTLNRELQEYFEIDNLLDVASVMTSAANFREESRGAHFRSDFPEVRDEWACNIVVQNQNGEPSLRKRGLKYAKAS